MPEQDERPPISEALLNFVATQSGTGAPEDDLERRYFSNSGPHEAWNEPDPEAESDEALVDALVAADEEARALTGSTAETFVECPKKPLGAIEVTLRDKNGPLRGLRVELHRVTPAGVLIANTNDIGHVRFEGLVQAESHQLAIGGMPASAWSIAKHGPLAKDRAECSHAASWSNAGGDDTRARTHETKQGQSIWTIAQLHGLDPEALWEANKALENDGRSMHVLMPGDEITLPTPDEKDERKDVSVGDELEIESEAELPRIRFRFLDDEGKPIDASTVEVECGPNPDEMERVFEGTLDSKGELEITDRAEPQVPGSVTRIRVTVAPPEGPAVDVDGLELPEQDQQILEFEFLAGHLDPISTVSGVQGRLVNLGYPCGDERGELGPLTKRAIRDFRSDHEVEPGALIDDTLQSKLDEQWQ